MDTNTNQFVVDASFVLSFLLPDERSFQTDHLFNQFKSNQINFISTQLLQFEVANALRNAVARKRISQAEAEARLTEFIKYQIQIENIDLKETFNLAKKLALTIYDSSYLYLSIKNNIPLLTLDDKLSKSTS